MTHSQTKLRHVCAGRSIGSASAQADTSKDGQEEPVQADPRVRAVMARLTRSSSHLRDAAQTCLDTSAC